MPKGRKGSKKVRKEYCSENPQNFCLQQKKYKSDAFLITDYDIFFDGRPKIMDLVGNIDNTLNNVTIKKTDNLSGTNSNVLKEIVIRDVNQIVDKNVENDKIFIIYIQLRPDIGSFTDTYKYMIQLEDGYKMDYYRLLRIIGHSTKNLIEHIQKEHETKLKAEMAKKERKEANGGEYRMKVKYNFEPIDRMNEVFVKRIGIAIHDSEENVQEVKEIEVVINGFDTSLDEMEFTI